MNLVTLNTAEQNEKIAADFRAGILPDDEWEKHTAVMLGVMELSATNGVSSRQINPQELRWKNQQGVSVLEFLQKKGYTCSLHYTPDTHKNIGYFKSWIARFGADYTIKDLNDVIRQMTNESGYNKHVWVSSDGSEGVPLEKAMITFLNPLKEMLQQCEEEVEREIAVKLAAYENKKAEAEKLRLERAEIEDTKNQIFFFIGVIVAIAGVFLMFK